MAVATREDARIWELYLFAALVEMGYRIERIHAVPDFACVGLPSSSVKLERRQHGAEDLEPQVRPDSRPHPRGGGSDDQPGRWPQPRGRGSELASVFQVAVLPTLERRAGRGIAANVPEPVGVMPADPIPGYSDH